MRQKFDKQEVIRYLEQEHKVIGYIRACDDVIDLHLYNGRVTGPDLRTSEKAISAYTAISRPTFQEDCKRCDEDGLVEVGAMWDGDYRTYMVKCSKCINAE